MREVGGRGAIHRNYKTSYCWLPSQARPRFIIAECLITHTWKKGAIYDSKPGFSYFVGIPGAVSYKVTIGDAGSFLGTALVVAEFTLLWKQTLWSVFRLLDQSVSSQGTFGTVWGRFWLSHHGRGMLLTCNG